MKATTFDWNKKSFGFIQKSGPNIFIRKEFEKFDLQTIRTGDFNGDGKTDFLRLDPTDLFEFGYSKTILYTTTKDGYTVADVPGLDVFSGIGNYIHDHKRIIIADFDGNGLSDILHIKGFDSGLTTLYLANKNGFSSIDGPDIHIRSAHIDLDIGSLKLGDFNGDGRTDIFSVSNIITKENKIYYSNGNNFIIKDTGLPFSVFDINGLNRLHLADFNGDGKTDIIRLNGGDSDNTTIYYSYENNRFVTKLPNEYYNPKLYLAYSSLSFDLQRIKLGDFNGDGITDILRLDGINSGNSTIHYLTGNGFITKPGPDLYVGTDSYIDISRVIIGDFNGDGKSDIAKLNVNNFTYIFYATGSDFVQRIGPIFPSSTEIDISRLIIGEINGDNKVDFLRLDGSDNGNTTLYYPNSKDLEIKTFDNGLSQTHVNYDYLTNSDIYQKLTDSVYPLVDLQIPLSAVTAVDSDNGIGGTNQTSYFYTGMKSHQQGRGILGFKEIDIRDESTSVSSFTRYRQDFPFTGFPEFSQQYFNNTGIVITETTNQYGLRGDSERFLPYSTSSEEKIFTLTGKHYKTTKTSNDIYDDYGNVHQMTVTNTVIHKTGQTETITTVNNNEYNQDDLSNWFLGRLTKASATTTYNGESITKTSAFHYNPFNWLIRSGNHRTKRSQF